ncbi:hypothetical protein ABPG75_012713 [Micractinium tetrahymenae]
MASFSEQELHQACSLLAAEFPDVPRSVLESVLRECELELPLARRKLLERQPQAAPQQAGTSYGGQAAAAEEDDGDAWFDWNKSMRDLGLESLGAQLSLLGRQVATSLNAILPADLNPFGFDDEELEEEAAAAAAKAAADAEREKRSTAVGASTRQLNSRRGGGAAARSPGSSRLPTEEEEEEEDYDKLN